MFENSRQSVTGLSVAVDVKSVRYLVLDEADPWPKFRARIQEVVSVSGCIFQISFIHFYVSVIVEPI